MIHPLDHGQIIYSPGCHFSYRVIGSCCRLFDREQLPWPCCRLQWRGKEPSWRRIGRRFTVDLATRGHPTYSVEVLESGRLVRGRVAESSGIHAASRIESRPIGFAQAEPLILTLYWVKLPQPISEWWFSERLKRHDSLLADPPIQPSSLVMTSNNSGSAEDTKTEG